MLKLRDNTLLTQEMEDAFDDSGIQQHLQNSLLSLGCQLKREGAYYTSYERLHTWIHPLTVSVKEALSELEKTRKEPDNDSKLRYIMVASSYALELSLSYQSKKKLDSASTQEIIPETYCHLFHARFLMCAQCVSPVNY